MGVSDNWPAYRLRRTLRRAWSRIPGASQRVHVEEYTMLSRERLRSLERSARTVINQDVAGHMVECGTAEGGSAALLALWSQRLRSDKKVYVFDTFEGLPPPNENDPDYDRAVAWTGKCRGTLDQVQGLFESLDVRDRAVFIQGKFQDTLPTFEIPPIALLHLDGDWYDSTMVCLQHLWDHVSPGGVVQIDDYGSWAGCRKAVDEFLQTRGITDPLQVIDRNGRLLVKSGQGVRKGNAVKC